MNANTIESKQEENQEVDVAKLIEDLFERINILSQYHMNLLNKLNDVYIRLEILSKVVEDLASKLEISDEDYINIVHKSIAEVKKVLDKHQGSST